MPCQCSRFLHSGARAQLEHEYLPSAGGDTSHMRACLSCARSLFSSLSMLPVCDRLCPHKQNEWFASSVACFRCDAPNLLSSLTASLTSQVSGGLEPSHPHRATLRDALHRSGDRPREGTPAPGCAPTSAGCIVSSSGPTVTSVRVPRRQETRILKETLAETLSSGCGVTIWRSPGMAATRSSGASATQAVEFRHVWQCKQTSYMGRAGL